MFCVGMGVGHGTEILKEGIEAQSTKASAEDWLRKMS